MNPWETEDEFTGPIMVPMPPLPALPTPADTPYRTPSRTSRRSRRSLTPPGKAGNSSSPPPARGDRGDRGSKRSSRDVSHDENISMLDPRRFTPTLHANLVSEILSLRRDQEEKLKFIEGLEASLLTSREESEKLQTTLTTTAKESRSLKRQLALLEGGTSSALGELARERDEAVDASSETKKRLETMQKKLRTQEEDSDRVHNQWATEKADWEEEKRKFERKIHITESRLMMVLNEVAVYQNQMSHPHDMPESEVEESGKENDAASIRTMSITNSIRFSVMNNGAKPPNGNSLADELNFDTEYDDETDYGGRESVLSNARHHRNASRDSAMSRTHRRNQSTESLMRPGSVARGRLAMHHSTLEKLEDRTIREDDETPQLPTPAVAHVIYTDTGIQYSPPPSPVMKPAKPSTPEPPAIPARFDRTFDVESPPRADGEIEANQRRKRVPSYMAQPLTIKPPVVNNLMVNGSSQTAEEPLSPPRTPTSPYQESPPTPSMMLSPTASSSTQTDEIPPPLRPSFFDFSSMPIPSISIIPPTSRPTTPKESRLPQQFKDFGCQVAIVDSYDSRSTAVQTEEIRVDTRLDRLPAHLHPSAITSRPTSPAAPAVDPSSVEDARQFTPVPSNLPPRNPRRLATKKSLTDVTSSPPVPLPFSDDARDSYPGNNDDGPLSTHRAPMRRPPRISSLFAGFDGGSSDEADEFLEGDASDSEFRTALSAPKPAAGARGGKRGSVERPMSRRMSGGRNATRPFGGSAEPGSVYGIDQREAPPSRSESKRMARPPVLGASSSKSSIMRKAAMIQNGIVSHQRPRSPSLPDAREPPFPIPTRASSRKPPVSASAPSDGRASPTRGSDGWSRRGSGRHHYRANSIRKVRSAAALPRNQRHRRQSSRSPPFSPSTEAPESPGLPPLPTHDFGSSRNRDSYARSRSHAYQLSTNTANTGDTGVGSTGSSNPTVGVVDAIAQTMVGEWMFKYVRRRKSFGVAEKGTDDSSNDRHKRWVWLAPYERAILWSSKQPSSGSALMGKSGRKRKFSPQELGTPPPLAQQ